MNRHRHLIKLSYCVQQEGSQQEKLVLICEIILYLLMAGFLGNPS